MSGVRKGKGAAGGRKCGAKLPTPRPDGRTTCDQPAGYGTDHIGWGRCKWHMGSTRALKVAAAREEANELIRTLNLGKPIPVSPDEALLQELWRTNGIVHYLQDYIGSAFSPEDLVYLTEVGMRPRAFLDILQREREHLAKVAKMTLDAGVAERQVRIQEAMGQMFASVIQAVLRDLKLSPNQKQLAPAVVRKHLLTLPVADAG